LFYSVKEFLSYIKNRAKIIKLPVTHIKIGKTRSNNDIYALQISNMPFNAIFLGFPHPNEPLCEIVLAKVLELAKSELVGENIKNWFIVPVWDIDGAKINQKWWIKDKISIVDIVDSWYRPSPGMQVEWTFPIKYKDYTFNSPLPETNAIKKIIDQNPPDLLISLHDGLLSDAYMFISSDIKELSCSLSNTLTQFGLISSKYCPIPYIETYEKGIYSLPYAKNELKYLSKLDNRLNINFYENGASSFEYVNSDCTCLVLELPLFKWIHATEHKIKKKELARKKILYWDQFQFDLDEFFTGEKFDKTNILISSPYYFFKRSEADTKMLHDIIKPELNNNEYINDSDFKSYFNMLFTISTQYSQLFRASSYKSENYTIIKNELFLLENFIYPINFKIIENTALQVINTIITWIKEYK